MGVMYRPPVIFKHFNKGFETQLQSMLSKISESLQDTLLLGDLDANCLK